MTTVQNVNSAKYSIRVPSICYGAECLFSQIQHYVSYIYYCKGVNSVKYCISSIQLLWYKYNIMSNTSIMVQIQHYVQYVYCGTNITLCPIHLWYRISIQSNTTVGTKYIYYGNQRSIQSDTTLCVIYIF